MDTFDQRVGAYIEKSADFAKPILIHLREIIHRASPEIKETIKWSFPHFEHKGTVCSIASFKNHCAFGFWKSSLLPDPYNLLNENESAMGQFGRIACLADLPPDQVLIEYIQNAVILNETGIKVQKRPSIVKTELEIPDYFLNQLIQNPEAKNHFEKFSNSHRKEYMEWIVEAKTEETRQKRMSSAIEWLNEGKSRHWKYVKK